MNLLTLPGCSGCLPNSDTAVDSTKEDRIEDYESGELNILPTDETTAAHGAKPGHWWSVRQRLKSNKVDFDGQLSAVATDAAGQPLALTNSTIHLRSQRPASLPKGQGKTFELSVFVPHAAARNRRVWMSSELQTRYGGASRHKQPQVTNRLRPHQAYFVVLARNADQYNYLKTLESIRPPSDELKLGDVPGDYMVVSPSGSTVIPLPAWSMMWTSISYVALG